MNTEYKSEPYGPPEGPVSLGEPVSITTSGIPTPTNLPEGIPPARPLEGGAWPYVGAAVNVPIYITLGDIRKIIAEEIGRELKKQFAEWEQRMKDTP